MLKLDRKAAGAETLKTVKKILADNFETQEEVEGIYSMSGGGINDTNHVVAQTTSGKRYGIKTRARGGGPQGSQREVAFSRACREVGIAEASKAVLIPAVPNLDGFENDPSVITEWRSGKRPSEMTEDEIKDVEHDPTHAMAQVGKWVATNLHLGLADRGKLDNWVWSPGERQLVAIDTESAFQNASVADHSVIIDRFYGVAKLKDDRGKSSAARAFEQALRETHARFRGQAAALSAAVKVVDANSNYTSPFHHLTEDQFADKVFSEL